ncbi:hypothetical protein EK904_012173 [Melospiza melodia maxima]|nr:hypothetical protein EK904_012173 [Melospiza melodia maxima]
MGSHAEGWPVAHSGNQSGSALAPSVVLGRSKLLSYSFTLLFAFIQHRGAATQLHPPERSLEGHKTCKTNDAAKFTNTQRLNIVKDSRHCLEGHVFCSLTFHRPAALPLLRGTGGSRVSGASRRRSRGASRGFWPRREPLDSTAGAMFLTIVCPLPPVLLLPRRGMRRERGDRERGNPAARRGGAVGSSW